VSAPTVPFCTERKVVSMDKELKKVKENRLTKKQQNAINLLIYSNKSQKQIAKAVEAMSETTISKWLN